MESIVDLPVKISKLYTYLLQNIKNKMVAPLIPQNLADFNQSRRHLFTAGHKDTRQNFGSKIIQSGL